MRLPLTGIIMHDLPYTTPTTMDISGMRHAARVHADLLSRFIALTHQETRQQGHGFVGESLHETLAMLETEREKYLLVANDDEKKSPSWWGHAPANFA